MILNRGKIGNLYNLIQQKYNLKFPINAQYKMIKIKNFLANEFEIYNQQVSLLSEYFQKDEEGNIVQENGVIKIQPQYLQQCAAALEEINNMQIQLPDIYFSLDELEPLNLTLGELELLEPFIKI